MKSLREMKKPCIRFLSIALMVIVAMALVAHPALAAQHLDNPLLDSRMERELNRAINRLERYLSISETGNIVLDAPKGVVNSIDSEVYQSLLAGLEQTNALIDSGELVANPDFTLTVAGMDSVGGVQTLSSSGGITDIKFYWWGFKLWLSDYACDTIVFAFETGGITLATVSAVLAIGGITVPGAIVTIILAGLIGIGAAIISYYNRNNTGIIMRFHWLFGLTGVWSQ